MGASECINHLFSVIITEAMRYYNFEPPNLLNIKKRFCSSTIFQHTLLTLSCCTHPYVSLNAAAGKDSIKLFSLVKIFSQFIKINILATVQTKNRYFLVYYYFRKQNDDQCYIKVCLSL